METLNSFDGFGLGLRTVHFNDYLTREIPVDFVEIISENFMIEGGRPLRVLDAVRERHAVVMHGVSMSLGSAGGLDPDYLARLKALAERARPLWISDHLCWTGVDGFNSHDLLPLPYTEEALDVVCANIRFAQDFLERPILVENPSSYVAFSQSVMTEWEFLRALCERTGCYLLLDVNNIYVSAVNHGFDPSDYIDGAPLDRVRQIHLAGHSVNGDLLIDTHDHDVPEPVWRLYETVRRRIPEAAAMIERDDNIPPLGDLLGELDIARAHTPRNREAAA
ncbi:MAG: DUF692 family protein [Alphaproteobacteria bacterium]|nr:DUF692 family protein [Alphaproteobacteria bacterium]